MRSSQNLFQADQAQLPQLAFTGEVFSPSEHLCVAPLDPFQKLHILLVLGAQAWMQYSTWGPHDLLI